MVTGVVPSPPRFLLSVFIAHRVQQSHCSSTFHRVLLTHALALSASQFVHKKKSQRIFTSMHSAGLELTKLTYTRLEDNLIRHRGDRLQYTASTSDYWIAVATALEAYLIQSICKKLLLVCLKPTLHPPTRIMSSPVIGHYRDVYVDVHHTWLFPASSSGMLRCINF